MERELSAWSVNEPTFVHRSSGELTVLCVDGELDLSTVANFELAIAEAAVSERVLLVDLTRCRYIDAAVLGALVRARKRLGVRLRVALAARSVAERIVRLAGLGDYLNVISTIGPSAAA